MGKRVAVVFPGQGSQALGMVDPLLQDFPWVEESFALASEVLGYDLPALTRGSSRDVLDRTERAQPVILAVSVACWRVLQRELGLQPVMFAGHSLGEYSALVCAGSLQFEDALRLVAERGRRMQEAVPEGQGGMAAIIGLQDNEVSAVCDALSDADGLVAPANFNAPGQVVISGTDVAVKQAMERCLERGAKRAMLLPVSVPSHCELMRPAAERFSKFVESVRLVDADIPVVQNLDAVSRSVAADLRPALVSQMYRPVQWVRSMRFICSSGVTVIIECGFGKTLCGLSRRCVPQLLALPMHKQSDLDRIRACLYGEEKHVGNES